MTLCKGPPRDRTSVEWLLTLLATPVAYSLFDDLQEKLRRKKEAPAEMEPVAGGVGSTA